MRLIKINCFNFEVVTILFLSICLELKCVTAEPPLYCLQKRENKQQFQDCKGIDDGFCSNVQCEPITECSSDLGNKELVHNITGRGCCPACVEYLDEDENCEIGSQLKKCRNGLFCNPSTKQCNIPGIKNKCLVEYHNRRLVSSKDEPMSFYLQSGDLFFAIPYNPDIEFPACDYKTGKYQPKQCRQKKCFCVNPEDGKYTFGLTEKYRAENVTCECSNIFYNKLVGDGNINKTIDMENMEHYSQIHSKCDSSGNFEPLQCINSTCFCVDEKTGKPTNEKAVIYGALSALPCFDDEKSKKLKTKEADANYQSSCEKLLLRTKSISLHFSKKGTKLRGLDSITCQFDGEFSPKQCLPGSCNCVNPKGFQMNSYGVDRQGGKDSEMECKCAREEYFSEIDKLSYDQQQCDGSGNFNAFQCYDNQRECFCVDDDGSPISKSESSHCLDKFIRDTHPNPALLKEDICKGMRKTLTKKPLSKDIYYKFDAANTDFIPMSDKPKQMYECSTQIS